MKTVGHLDARCSGDWAAGRCGSARRGEDGEAVGLPDPEGVIADQRLDALLDRPDGALGRIEASIWAIAVFSRFLSSIRSPGVSRVTGVVRR